jgi:putative ABC transport system permease protein
MRTGNASFWEAVKGAAQSLRSAKLRSFLTLLGIILATTTLISVMSVISGMDVVVAQQVTDLGANGYTIARIVMMQWDPKKFLEMQRRNPLLNQEEFDFLRSRATLSSHMGLSAQRGVTVNKGKERSENVELRGASPSIAIISNYQAETGRFFSEIEDDRRMDVAFIGHDIQTKFFGGADPLGKTVEVEGTPFTIVGVSKAKGNVLGQSQDNFLVIPVQTYFKKWSARQGMLYYGMAVDHEHLFQAQEEARMLLRAYRHLKPKDDDTFSMLTSDALLNFWNQLTAAISATAIGVVSVFMVVGGVVIMNIMLAVVTERTHEIGIRKSVGARHRDILNQFLVESAMLAASGGLIGVTIAWVISLLVSSFTPVPSSIPITAVIVGVGLSAAVGLFFGIYPARQAARLDPIEALRMER